MSISFKTTFGPGYVAEPMFETMYFPAGESHVKLIPGVVVVPDDWTPEFTTSKEEPIFVSTMTDEVRIRDRADAMNSVITGVLEGKLPNGYAEPLMPGQEKHYTGGPSMAIGREEELEFIDERDSWVVDHSLLGRRRIRDMEEMFKAAGLNMEIRVWKDK